MTTFIRSALPGDIQSIVDLGRRSFTWAFGHLYREDALARYLDATYSPGKISSSLAKSANTYFVAEVNGSVRGFLKLKQDCPHPSAKGPGVPWQTQKLYVDPAALHAGIGRQLMGAGEAWMRARGAGSTWLVVYQGNEPAIHFYEALGFQQAGVEFHDFEELRVEFKLMEKIL